MFRPSQSSQLKVAVELIRSRQCQEALKLLIPLLKENPQSEEGWMLLSYAVQDPKQKRDCLLKVLQLNPDHIRAKERLAKLDTMIIPAPSQAVRSKSVEKRIKSPQRFRKWKPLLIAILSFGLIAALIYWGSQSRLTDIFKQQEPRIALQPGQYPSSTPFPPPISSSTPSPTATITLTTSPTPIASATSIPPTPTYNFAAPTGDLAQEMDDIQNQVSTIRGLPILMDNPRYIVPPPSTLGFLSSFLQERYEPDKIKDEVRVLSALGLVVPTYDLHRKILNNIGEGLGGFYIPWKDEIFVSSGNFGAVERLVYAHEYNHALIDQHFHLEEMETYPECIDDTDHCMAITALIEGDATYLMYQWLQAYAAEDEMEAIHHSTFSPIDQVISSIESPPPYFIRETYFNYFDGQNFVAHLYDQGGWSAVDTAYTSPPLSSEQILHPEKYQTKELPDLIALVPLDETLGEDWRHLKTDTLGELYTQMILGYSANYLVQIDPIAAAEAAAGWGGDQYQVYYHSKSNRTILVAQWQWDSQVDSLEFWDAMGNYLNRRYAGRLARETDETCYTLLNDHVSCIFRTAQKTLWVMAPDLEVIDVLTSLYPEFRH